MSLTNKPKKSKYQVGETVYFLNGTKGDSAEVVKVITSVTDPESDDTGVQENIYYLDGFIKEYRETELFHSMNALMFNIKGDYLSKLGNSDQVNISSTLLTISDFSYSLLSETGLPSLFIGIDFTSTIFDGCKLEEANFTSAILVGCSFRFANLTGAVLTDADMNLTDCRGANLTNAILPSDLNTKLSFKAGTGAGHWDAETTIWIDGNPIG